MGHKYGASNECLLLFDYEKCRKFFKLKEIDCKIFENKTKKMF